MTRAAWALGNVNRVWCGPTGFLRYGNRGQGAWETRTYVDIKKKGCFEVDREVWLAGTKWSVVRVAWEQKGGSDWGFQ